MCDNLAKEQTPFKVIFLHNFIIHSFFFTLQVKNIIVFIDIFNNYIKLYYYILPDLSWLHLFKSNLGSIENSNESL